MQVNVRISRYRRFYVLEALSHARRQTYAWRLCDDVFIVSAGRATDHYIIGEQEAVYHCNPKTN